MAHPYHPVAPHIIYMHMHISWVSRDLGRQRLQVLAPRIEWHIDENLGWSEVADVQNNTNKFN